MSGKSDAYFSSVEIESVERAGKSDPHFTSVEKVLDRGLVSMTRFR